MRFKMCATVNKQHIRNSRALASFGAALSVLLGTAVPVSADLVAYWTFNDHADGTLLSATQDSSGNGYTVTNVGTASYAPHISDTDPLYGNHLARDGATVESKSNCNITSAGVYSNNMTISFWGTQPTTNWRNYLTLRTGSTGEELQFQKANNGLVVYKSNNKNQNAINMVGSSTLDLGSDWHHFVVTVDSAAQKAYMYVDGELINEKEWTHAEQITDLTFNGAWSFGGRGSDADLDEVQIYDQAMTAEQVKYLYNNPSLYHAAVYQRNVSGSGNWSDTLWDANGLTGQTFANSSAVKLTASNSPTLTLDQAVTVNSLDFNGSMTIGGTNTLTFNGEKRITVANAADTATISTPINALYDNGLTKTGAGTLTLNNNQSTFTGNVVVNGGTLIASASWKYVDTTVFGDYVSKTVTVNDGAELVFAAQDVVSNSGTNSPIQFIVNGGTIRNSGTVYNNLANTVFTDGAQLYAADGNATWKAYKLSSKVSVLRNTDGSAAQPVTFSSDLTKANATYSFGNGTSIYVEDITSSSGAADANADLIVSALVTNPNQESNGTFHKDGAGILEFTAANTFNGTASIREGVLRLSGNGALGTSTVTLGDKGTLELNVADGAEKTFTNKVTGAGKVAKTGAGTLKLNTANGFETSSLNVSAGRANVVGTLSGDLAIADGASFSPGDGIGTLTVNGLFSADDGARLVFELGVDASDLLILGSGSTLDIADDAVIELLFADADPDKAYTLIQAEDGLGEYTDSAFWTNLLTAASDATWDLSVVGNTIQAIAGSGTIDPSDPSVPEPAAWVLLLLGTFGLLYCRKK